MLLNYFLAVLALAFSFAGTVFMSGGALSGYLDIPSILIMVFFPLVYQCLLFGVATAKNAFTAGFRKDATMEQLTKAQLFFKSYSRVIWITALVVALIGTVAILKYLEDRAMLGPNFALALISLLYGGLIHLVIILPNAVFLKKRLIEINMDI
jgi:flagellar motor component MotA